MSARPKSSSSAARARKSSSKKSSAWRPVLGGARAQWGPWGRTAIRWAGGRLGFLAAGILLGTAGGALPGLSVSEWERAWHRLPTALSTTWDGLLQPLVDLGHALRQDGAGASSAARRPAVAVAQDTPTSTRQMRPGRDFADCASQFPRSIAIRTQDVSTQWKPEALCFDGFAVLYSGLSRTPMVAIERLDAQGLKSAAEQSRTDEFFADERLPGGMRAELSDYSGSGYDRGHMAAAANRASTASMVQSFALSNMVPQDPTNNRKVWADLEGDVRKFVRRADGAVYVFSGPLFEGARRTIGADRVWVPSHLFKLVYDEAGQRAWAYVLPNTADATLSAPMDYGSFVERTGWNFLSAVPVRAGVAR